MVAPDRAEIDCSVVIDSRSTFNAMTNMESPLDRSIGVDCIKFGAADVDGAITANHGSAHYRIAHNQSPGFNACGVLSGIRASTSMPGVVAVHRPG